MARPKKPINHSEELSKIDAKIERHNQLLTKLQEQRKLILNKQKQAELDELYDIIKKSGKSVQEIISEIEPSEEAC